MHKIATKNFDRLNCKLTCKSFNIDARLFTDYKDYDVFFLFNPFNDDVYLEVMTVVRRQIEGDFKRRWLIAYGRSNEIAILSIENIKLLQSGVCPYRKNNFSLYQIN